MKALVPLLFFLAACSFAGPDAGFPPPDGPAVADRHASRLREALWVFTDEVQRPADQTALLSHAVEAGVTVLYLSVYQPRPNGAGRYMYDEAAIATFVRRAQRRGIQVWVAFGAVSWHEYGCRPGTPPYDRIQEVLAYNAAHPEAAFDGIMLDLEMPEPADLEALLSVYEEILDTVRPAGLPVAGAIRFFWDRPAARRDGTIKPAFQHFIDLDLDHVVVMAYRNYAGDGCDDDGIICLSRDEVAYAEAQGGRGRVVVGLRATSPADDSDPGKTTFFGLPEDVYHREKDRTAAYFAKYESFGGFALHQYRDE